MESRKCYEAATKHGKPVIVMEPIKGGTLVNVPEEGKKLFQDYAPERSVASQAIRFAASLPNVMMVLSGMSNEEQMADNISYMKQFTPMNDEEQSIIVKAREIIRSKIAIPCTACRYCVDGCPMKIAIPDYFSIYNNLKQFGPKQGIVAHTYYGNLTQTRGKASACIKCGKCESHCPPSIFPSGSIWRQWQKRWRTNAKEEFCHEKAGRFLFPCGRELFWRSLPLHRGRQAQHIVFTHMSGRQQTREEYLTDIESGSLRYFTIGIESPTITVDGDTASIAYTAVFGTVRNSQRRLRLQRRSPSFGSLYGAATDRYDRPLQSIWTPRI